MTKAEILIVPETENTPATYRKLFEALTSNEFRDFVRTRISVLACRIPDIVEAEGSSRSDKVAIVAGEINTYKYLLTGAVSDIEKKLELQEVEKTDTTIEGRFASKIQEDFSDN